MERHAAEIEGQRARVRFRRWLLSVLAMSIFVAVAIAWIGWSEDSPGQHERAGRASTDKVDSAAAAVQPASISTGISGATRSARARSISYDANAPLSSQLRALRRHADQGDRYAACILAFALDLCARGAERVITDDYAHTISEAVVDEAVDRMAVGMAFKERHALACIGMEEERYEDVDRRLLASALAGHVPSMRNFALLPSRPGRGVEGSDPELAQAHRRHAERMLNAAAEAGDPQAVRAVHYAYAMGYITNGFDELPVEKDAAKTYASLLVMSRHARSEDVPAMQRAVAQSVETMAPAEFERFARLKSAYDRQGNSSETLWRGGDDVMKDFPEVACADVEG